MLQTKPPGWLFGAPDKAMYLKSTCSAVYLKSGSKQVLATYSLNTYYEHNMSKCSLLSSGGQNVPEETYDKPRVLNAFTLCQKRTNVTPVS